MRVNGVDVEMEIDSGAEHTTIPWSYFNQYLTSACELRPTSVTLYQYDKSPLVVKGECHTSVQVNEPVIVATFIVVDAEAQYPLFGRDWMSLSVISHFKGYSGTQYRRGTIHSQVTTG